MESKGYELYNELNNAQVEHYVKWNDTFDDTLKGFVNFLGLRLEPTTKYNYVSVVNNFLLHVNKDAKDLNYMDYVGYINRQKNKTSSRQIVVYSALKKFSKFLVAAEICNKDYVQDIARPKAVESQETLKKRADGKLTKIQIKCIYNIFPLLRCRMHEYYKKKYHVGIITDAGYIPTDTELFIPNKKEFDMWKNCNVKDNIKEEIEGRFSEFFPSLDKNFKTFCLTYRDEAIVKVFLTTGIRVAELTKLDLESYDKENHILTITAKGNKVQNKPLTESSEKALLNWLKVRSHLLSYKNVDEQALFLNPSGNRLSAVGIRKMINKYTELITGTQLSPHKLRATYITTIYESTHDVYFAQQAVGHKSPATTERYIRLDEKKQLERKRAVASTVFDNM